MVDSKLTVAQALRRIKDLKGRVGASVRNAQMSVTHRTLAAPAYSFHEEWEKAQQLVGELLDLQERLAITNAITLVDVGGGRQRSLAWACKKLAEIKGAIALFEALGVKAAEKTTEVEGGGWAPGGLSGASNRVEVEYTCHLPERKRAAAVEALRASFAELNDVVETTNHRTYV